jgi:hypothetical protein
MIQVIGGDHTNVFVIFRSSFYHFIRGVPLYTAYPKEYEDFFLYSPLFPLIFSPFALLPLNVGIIAWIAVSVVLCYYVFNSLPLPDYKRTIFAFLIAFELLNNLQDTQTNPVVLALMLSVWILTEKQKYFLAAFCITLCFIIKSYTAVIAVIMLYDKNWWKCIIYTIFWMICIHLISLIFISPQLLLQYYRDWIDMISSEGIKENFSVYGIIKAFNINGVKESYIILTALLLLISFMIIHYFTPERITLNLVAFLLIWMVVFNRAAESPTYLIALAGVILWYLNRPYSIPFSILFWVTLIVATLFPKDIVPLFDKLRYQYYLKVMLCILVLMDMLIFSISRLNAAIRQGDKGHRINK